MAVALNTKKNGAVVPEFNYKALFEYKKVWKYSCLQV
jgi:hypothetical protein